MVSGHILFHNLSSPQLSSSPANKRRYHIVVCRFQSRSSLMTNLLLATACMSSHSNGLFVMRRLLSTTNLYLSPLKQDWSHSVPTFIVQVSTHPGRAKQHPGPRLGPLGARLQRRTGSQHSTSTRQSPDMTLDMDTILLHLLLVPVLPGGPHRVPQPALHPPPVLHLAPLQLLAPDPLQNLNPGKNI